jgi:hypothetical protein
MSWLDKERSNGDGSSDEKDEKEEELEVEESMLIDSQGALRCCSRRNGDAANFLDDDP